MATEDIRVGVNIEPTVGRVVWYYPAKNEPSGAASAGPFAAIVARVLPNGTHVNVMVIDPEGVPSNRTHVRLVQEGEELPAGDPYCAWMPYQIGQARRHAAEVCELEEACEPSAPAEMETATEVLR